MLNRLILALTVGLYCSTFFLSNNWYIYSRQQNIFLIVGGTIICSLVILLASSIVAGMAKLLSAGRKKNIDPGKWADLLVIGLSLSLCVILLRNTFTALHLSPLIIIPLLAVIIIIARNKLKGTMLIKLSIVFFVLTAVSVSGLVISVFQDDNSLLSWGAQNKSFNDQIRFAKKPNVYFIITESYPSSEALEKIYHFDNSLFGEELVQRGFVDYHNYYSNYNHTLSSLPSLFGMEHHFYQINIGNFDSIGGRDMLEGKTYNPVIDIFRQNNYRIEYLLSVDSFLPRGAAVDYFFPKHPAYLALEVFLSHQDTTKQSIFAYRKQGFMEALAERFSEIKANSTPTFSFIYTATPHHSPSRIKTGNRAEINRILERFRQGYGQRIEAANAHLLEMLDLILKNDHDPLIIIAGDHGPWGYRIKEDGEGRIISDSLFALDRFGVLMAIRFPEDYRHQFDGQFKSHVNLFRYVFAYLSDSNRILERKAKDDSYDHMPRLSLAIRDGNILENYLPIKVVRKDSK